MNDAAPGTSYDAVPYRSLAFPQTHPDHLAATARIFNLTPRDPQSCRVLELGCAGGGNLVPMAFNLPGSEFVGVDLSPRQIDEANTAATVLDLGNVHFACASLVDIDGAWGEFDYIICHGVFSWVDRAVQDRILAIAAERLTPSGVAYISYNTYPGWHMRESVREMMRYHADQFEAPQDKVDQARALLHFLAGATQQSGPYGQLLHGEVERLDRAPDSYLFHEHLERANSPIYFHRFMERAGAAGLQFLAEAAVTEMLTSHFPPPVAETLERISPDILHLEQYMDFVRNRQFRQTLLCRAGLQPRRVLDPRVLGGMFLSSAALTDGNSVDLAPGVAVTFTDGPRRAQVASPATKAALALLIQEFPKAVGFEDLTARSLALIASFSGGDTVEESRAALESDLFGAVMHGLASLHTGQVPCANVVTSHPRAYPVAAVQALTSDIVVNARHAMVQLPPLELELLKLADGSRSREAIVAEADTAADAVDAAFENLRRHALFTA